MSSSLETGPPGQACQTWQPPECPFSIEWSAAVLEEIRAAAMEGLFSVPHGGAEIGGTLWGTRAAGRVRILAACPLECEHALGPTFTLSGKDYMRLAAVLQQAPEDGLKNGCSGLRAQGWEPVGWYHSHTRSEVLLSGRDVEVHNRHFPDPWHVALVVRPHAMLPMRAGFFFREANGSIHADSSYAEFVLQPAPYSDVEQPAPQSVVVQPAPPPVAVQPAPPAVVVGHAVSPAIASLKWLGGVVLVMAMAGALFALKSDVFGKAWTRVFAADRPPSIGLMAYDLNGQLQIRWDWAAEPIRSAEAGTLDISDGATHTVVALEKQRLRNGTVSYVRTGARVDLRLAVRQPGGKVRQEFTSFVGPAGGPQPDASTIELRRELDDQALRTGELERAVADLSAIAQRGRKPRH